MPELYLEFIKILHSLINLNLLNLFLFKQKSLFINSLSVILAQVTIPAQAKGIARPMRMLTILWWFLTPIPMVAVPTHPLAIVFLVYVRAISYQTFFSYWVFLAGHLLQVRHISCGRFRKIVNQVPIHILTFSFHHLHRLQLGLENHFQFRQLLQLLIIWGN